MQIHWKFANLQILRAACIQRQESVLRKKGKGQFLFFFLFFLFFLFFSLSLFFFQCLASESLTSMRMPSNAYTMHSGVISYSGTP